MQSAAPPLPPQPQPKTSGLAIASLICGLAGFVTAGLSGIAAIITGHMALAAIHRSGGLIDGRGMSIAGLVTGYLTVLILPVAVLAGLAAPVILQQRSNADRVECMSHMKALSVGISEFETHYGSRPCDRLAGENEELAGLTGSKVLLQLEAAGTPDVERFLTVRRPALPAVWIYFPESGPASDPTQPVLISPVIGEKINVLQVDGIVRSLASAELSRFDRSRAVEIPVPPAKR